MSVTTFSLQNATFEALRNAIHERLGLFYPDEQRDLLAMKLSPRLLELGLSSFQDYYYLLAYGREGEQEWRTLQSLLAVNESYFWREYAQIQAAVEHLLPSLLRERAGRPVRVWHAGCAAGEEPYTLAISLIERGLFLLGPLDILGSDMDEQALARARAGVYRPRALRALPPDLREKYFDPLPDGTWRLRESVRKRVRFLHLNLMDREALRRLPPLDVIFCRNVFIYFSRQAIRQVVTEFYDLLRPPGYLFVGAAESLLRVTTLFDIHEIGGAFVYTKAGDHPERGASHE